MRSRYKYYFYLGIFLGIFGTLLLIYVVNNPLLQHTNITQINIANNSIIPLTDRGYAPVVLKLINDANNSIDIALFEMKYYTSPQYENSSEDRLVNALINAAKRGVKIRVLLDEYANKSNNTANATINLLENNNISAKLDSPKTTNHNKLIIIDKYIVIIGSTNWSHYALERNHESAVAILDHNIANYFTNYFNTIWRE